MCVCCPESAECIRFRRLFYTELKGMCNRGSAERLLLEEGSLVVRLHGTRRAAESEWDHVLANVVGDVAEGIDVYEWWHIGAHEFS
eukprot:4078482-Pyramimonas_sp.AAC.1